MHNYWPKGQKRGQGSGVAGFLIEPIWESQRMSPNHTILSARCPKLEVATKPFWTKKVGGPPSRFWEAVWYFWKGYRLVMIKILCCDVCDHQKNTFFDVYKKGQKRVKKGPFLRGPQKRQKTAFLGQFWLPGCAPLLYPLKRCFWQKSSHMGAIIIFGTSVKTAFFRPFLGPQKTPKMTSKTTLFPSTKTIMTNMFVSTQATHHMFITIIYALCTIPVSKKRTHQKGLYF